jgi:hypothetical protein
VSTDQTGPRCGCGHLIWTHLADGRCGGCTGVCDSGPFVLPLPAMEATTTQETQR